MNRRLISPVLLVLALIRAACGYGRSEMAAEGPAGVVSYQEAYVPAEFDAPPDSEPVDGQPPQDMFFEQYGVNPFIDTEDDNLSTFAIYVSGSMDMENRLGLVKDSLRLLVAELRPTRVTAVMRTSIQFLKPNVCLLTT